MLINISAQNFYFKKLFINEGLPQSQVYSLIQDDIGFVWVGTGGGGVCRFDGNTFQTYTVDNGISSSIVQAMFQDSKKNIWIGTYEGGLNKFCKNEFSQIDLGSQTISVTCINEDKNGVVWVGTAENGIFLVKNDKAVKFHKIKELKDERINEILVDKSNNIWVATENQGLWKINDFENINYNEKNGFDNNSINALMEDYYGKIWISTKKSLFIHFENKVIKFDKIPFLNVSAIAQDKSLNIWFGLNGEGVAKYNGAEIQKFDASNGFDALYVTKIIVDKQGNIWIGTNGNGVFMSTNPKFSYLNKKDGLSGNIVTSILKDSQGSFWYATYDGGISKHTEFGKEYFNSKNGLNNNIIYSLAEDKKSRIWFASRGGGIGYVQNNHIQTYTDKDGLLSNFCNSICIDSLDNIWIASFSGISCFNGNEFFNFNKIEGKENTKFYRVVVDKNNDIWAGGEKGLLLKISYLEKNKNNIKSNNFKITKYFPKDNQFEKSISSIAFDLNNNLWIGTFGNGAYFFNKKMFVNFNTKNKLSSNQFFQVICDKKGAVWLGHEKGVDKLILNNNKYQIQYFDKEDGFVGVETNLNSNFLDKSNGRLYFGTIDGLMIYEPIYDVQNFYRPNTYISEVLLFMQKENWHEYSDSIYNYNGLPDGLVLGHSQNHITFRFIGLDFLHPEKLTFKYILEGFDKEWSPALKVREAVYSNLPPGKYTFKVKAIKSNGIEDVTVEKFSFKIKSPFWKTWWFYIVSITTISLFVLFVYRRRVRAFKEREIELQAQVRLRTSELETQKENIENQRNQILLQNKEITLKSEELKELNNILFDKSESLMAQREMMEETNAILESTNKTLQKLSIVARETLNVVVIYERDGEIEWANESFGTIYKQSLEQYTDKYGNTVYSLYPNKDIEEKIKEGIQSKMSITFEYCRLLNEKDELWTQTTLTPIVNEKDEIEKLVSIDTDITSLKKVESELRKQKQEFELEKQKSDNLLLNILPEKIAEELKLNGKCEVKNYEKATVLFTDFKDFSKISKRISNEKLIYNLNTCFSAFDDIVLKYKIEKIKTIGDAYFCAGGVTFNNPNNPINMILAAMEISKYMENFNKKLEEEGEDLWLLRIGLHTGPIISGVVGKIKFSFDIWGDTVNTGKRMETHCDVGKINISENTYYLIKNYIECIPRGEIIIKNNEEIKMFFVKRIKPEFSEDEEGMIPNKKLLNILALSI